MLIIDEINMALPRDNILSRYWYRQHPITKHMYLLYDLLCNNKMQVYHINYVRNVLYTYFNTISPSYIDLVLMSVCAADISKSCSIIH